MSADRESNRSERVRLTDDERRDRDKRIAVAVKHGVSNTALKERFGGDPKELRANANTYWKTAAKRVEEG